MMEFDLTVTGLDQFGQMADYFDIWWRARPPRLAAEAFAEDARLRLEDDETGPNGSKWDPWSDSYAATRSAGDKLLFDSGDLADSIEAKRDGSAYIVGSDMDYALVHQFGSLDGNTPDRPYVGVSDEIDAALDNILPDDFDAGWLRFQV